MKKEICIKAGSVFYLFPKQPFSNEIIVGALGKLNLSTDLSSFTYKKKRLPGWEVSAGFIQMFYSGKISFPGLKFDVYAETGGVVRRFRLKEPAVKLRARAKRHLQAKNAGKAKVI